MATNGTIKPLARYNGNGGSEQIELVNDAFSFELERETSTAESHPAPKAKWWHAAFHSVCAVVGAGVLGLPASFSHLGWAGGLFTLTLLGVISIYTSYLLSELHETDGKRLNSYREIGEAVWGRRAGWWAVAPVQYTLMVGLCITYSVTAGQSMKGVASSDCSGADCEHGLAPWIAVFGAVQLALSMVPDFHSLWWVSLLGALMSVCYSTVAAGASVAAALGPGPAPNYSRAGEPLAARVFGIFNALGGIAFTFGGQAVLPEIQATLARPPPTPKSMMRGIWAAYAVVIAAYYSVAVAGYAAFGAGVQPDVLLSIKRPAALVDAANLMVVIHVAAGYQIFAMPLFDRGEALVRRQLTAPAHPLALRFALRSAFVLATTGVACLLPFFGDLMGLIASIALMPITFVLPPLLWISARQPRGLELALNAGIAGMATALGLLAFVGSMRNIVVDATNYLFG